MGNEFREVRSFEDLDVWKQGRKIQRLIREITKSFPKYEQYRLTDQMVRSSRSVPRNIAEGYGRFHYQENIHFCRISRGSLTELLNDAITAYDERFIDKIKLGEIRKEIEINARLLNGYIRYLNNAKNGHQIKEPKHSFNADDPQITDN